MLRTTDIISNQVSPAVPIFDHQRLRSPRDGMDLLGIVGCGQIQQSHYTTKQYIRLYIIIYLSMVHGVYILYICDSAQEDNLLIILIIIQTETQCNVVRSTRSVICHRRLHLHTLLLWIFLSPNCYGLMICINYHLEVLVY